MQTQITMRGHNISISCCDGADTAEDPYTPGLALESSLPVDRWPMSPQDLLSSAERILGGHPDSCSARADCEWALTHSDHHDRYYWVVSDAASERRRHESAREFLRGEAS